MYNTWTHLKGQGQLKKCYILDIKYNDTESKAFRNI